MAGKQNKKSWITVRDITDIAVLACILFIQEELLTFLPNIQLTIFLLILYSKKLGFIRTSIIVAIHVILDNLVMGSFNLVYTPAMFIGWMTIPILICLFCKKTENPILLGIVGFICGFLYSWCFILPNYLIYGIKPLIYLGTDIIFEVILASVGFFTTLLLYVPCSKIFNYFNIGGNKH